MAEQRGVQTEYFGKWLAGYVRGIQDYRDCSVYYRHKTRNSATGVKTINGISGWGSNTANVDALVARPNGEIVLLVDFASSGFKSRKAIDDSFSFLMCDRFCVQDSDRSHCYEVTPETKLILAGALMIMARTTFLLASSFSQLFAAPTAHLTECAPEIFPSSPLNPTSCSAISKLRSNGCFHASKYGSGINVPAGGRPKKTGVTGGRLPGIVIPWELVEKTQKEKTSLSQAKST